MTVPEDLKQKVRKQLHDIAEQQADTMITAMENVVSIPGNENVSEDDLAKIMSGLYENINKQLLATTNMQCNMVKKEISRMTEAASDSNTENK